MTEWDLPASVEATSIERVGGGYAWESGVYGTTIAMAYLNQAASEAVSFNVVLKNSDGKELKESFWIKSGKAKGNKTFYTGKDGKDRPLPGYSVANSLCIAATGDSLAKCIAGAEKKTVNVYDPAQSKEVPLERPVIMRLLNKVVKVAVHQVNEDKNKKNDATGQYESTGEIRTTNECKFFGNIDGKTTEEILAGADAIMFDKWAEQNTGTVIDKTSKKSGSASAADIMGGGAVGTAATAENTTASLFD